jgi:hypothetical protein
VKAILFRKDTSKTKEKIFQVTELQMFHQLSKALEFLNLRFVLFIWRRSRQARLGGGMAKERGSKGVDLATEAAQK